MSDNLKWKTGLLSSDMPLEFEAADILVSKGFFVESGFRYNVSQAGTVKDACVDIHATAFTPFSNARKNNAQLELLIECRHRDSNEVWLFLPDLNKPGYYPAKSGSAIRVMDKFSPYVIESKAIADFDAQLPFCQKGLEMNLETGNISESVFKDGIAQLQYALPRLLTENTLSYLTEHPDDNVPFLFCPILLTTARLFVSDKHLTIQRINESSVIEDIAAQVPYLMMYSNYGPEFEAQCTSECERLKILQKSDKTMAIEQKKARYYETQVCLPFTIIDSLTAADRYYLETFFTHFIICNMNHFSELTNSIRKTVVSAMRTRKRVN